MATFSIEFLGHVDPEDYEGNPHLVGRLRFGDGPQDFISFHSPLEVWTREDYEAQWHDALSRVLSGQPAALATALYDESPGLFMMFELVPEGDTEVLIYERYPSIALPEDLHSLVMGKSEAFHERTSTADIAAFVSRLDHPTDP